MAEQHNLSNDSTLAYLLNKKTVGKSVDSASEDPLMDGTADVGTSAKYAREDHVHPTDTTREPIIHVATITLSSASWSGSGPYSQNFTISGATITNKTKVTIQPNNAGITRLITDGVSAIVAINNSGTLTAYTFGASPKANITAQVTYYETA